MASKPENQPSKAALEDETHSTLEREFWKKVTYNPPTYCADVAGTLFDGNNWGWDVSKLDSLLSRTLKKRGITLDGVNSSYLYFGMWRALFAWHTEDMDLYSVNYLHYGAPKFWYAIAPEDRERFEILAQGMVPEMWRACPEFLRHKELLISPTLLEQNGIPFTRMMQRRASSSSPTRARTIPDSTPATTAPSRATSPPRRGWRLARRRACASASRMPSRSTCPYSTTTRTSADESTTRRDARLGTTLTIPTRTTRDRSRGKSRRARSARRRPRRRRRGNARATRRRETRRRRRGRRRRCVARAVACSCPRDGRARS